MNMREEFEKWVLSDYNLCGSDRTFLDKDISGGYVWPGIRIAWKIWQAAQPEWIKCSERMPEEYGRYWCYVEEQNSLGKSNYQWNCSWNGDVWSDKALTGRVTHWIPLPNPPEE